MAKKSFVETLTEIKGIGQAKAEAIVDAGYTSFPSLQKANIEDLTAIKGVSETVAKTLIAEAKKQQKTSPKKPSTEKASKEKTTPPAKKTEESTTLPASSPKAKPTPPQRKKTTPSDEKDTAGYQVKQKPELTTEQHHALDLRKKIKQRTPTFLREEWFRYKRIPKNWRRPDGISSKMRRNYKYRPNKVRVGYRGPQMVRGLHPSGFEEVLIYTPQDLESLNPKTQAARIGGSVGTKKRLAIEKKAKELHIRILNL